MAGTHPRTAPHDLGVWDEPLPSQLLERTEQVAGERKLYVAVIADALRLVRWARMSQRTSRAAADALAWLTSGESGERSFRWWAEAIGLAPEPIERFIRARRPLAGSGR